MLYIYRKWKCKSMIDIKLARAFLVFHFHWNLGMVDNFARKFTFAVHWSSNIIQLYTEYLISMSQSQVLSNMYNLKLKSLRRPCLVCIDIHIHYQCYVVYLIKYINSNCFPLIWHGREQKEFCCSLEWFLFYYQYTCTFRGKKKINAV